MKLFFATSNAGKLRELRELVGSLFEVVSSADVPGLPEIVEDEPTFEGNARKKAVACARATGLPSLADDSGLCVDALGARERWAAHRQALGGDERRAGSAAGRQVSLCSLSGAAEWRAGD